MAGGAHNPAMMGKKANLSPLMEAKNKAEPGTVPNFCPHAPGDPDHLDVFGYCDHLLGFTTPGETLTANGQPAYEPLVSVKDPVDGSVLSRRVDGRNKKPIPKGATLVRITSSSRVYAPLDDKTKKGE